MPRNGHPASLFRVLELTVTSTLRHLTPTVRLNPPQYITNFHLLKEFTLRMRGLKKRYP